MDKGGGVAVMPPPGGGGLGGGGEPPEEDPEKIARALADAAKKGTVDTGGATGSTDPPYVPTGWAAQALAERWAEKSDRARAEKRPFPALPNDDVDHDDYVDLETNR